MAEQIAMIVIFTGFAQVADVTLGSWIRGEAQQRVLTNSALLIYICICEGIQVGLLGRQRRRSTDFEI
jgi:hypothetical protein